MGVTKKYIDSLSYSIIGSAIEVHKLLGPGLLESVYQKCLVRELVFRNFEVKSQLKVPINYKGLDIEADLRLDILVDDLVVVEIKAVDAMNPVYEAQILSYMKLLNNRKGYFSTSVVQIFSKKVKELMLMINMQFFPISNVSICTTS